MAQPPLLSIVTGTRHREASFERMLRSVIDNTDVPWELLVAQVSYEPYACQRVQLTDRVRFFEEKPALGPAKGYNRLFRRARGEWVAWLNDDAVVEPGWASWAISYMRERPQVGIGAMYFAIRGSEGNVGYHTQSWLGLPYANFGVIRRELGDQVGWFDDDVIFYGNDNSLAFKVYLSGKSIHGLPGSKVVHYLCEDPQRKVNLKHHRVDNDRLYARYNPRLAEMRRAFDACPNPFPETLSG